MDGKRKEKKKYRTWMDEKYESREGEWKEEK